MDSNGIFLEHKSKLLSGESANEDAQRSLYSKCYQQIVAVPNSKNANDVFTLSLQATSKQGSFDMLSSYISMIEQRARSEVMENFRAAIAAKRNEINQQIVVLEKLANSKLQTEIKRTEVAYNIATTAGWHSPIQNLLGSDLFDIAIGSNALKAKLVEMKSLEDLSMIEPRLLELKARLSLLESLDSDTKAEFDTIRFLDAPERPIGRDKPKRALITIIGALFGGMIGLAVVLLHFMFRKEQ